MNKNRSNNILIYIILAIVAIVSVAILLSINNIPNGLPNDYFDKIETLKNEHINIYMYSDEIDLNNDYNYVTVVSSSDIIVNTGYNHVLIIDMHKFNEFPFISEENLEFMYHFNHLTIIANFIDFTFKDSDLIVYSYDSTHTPIKGSVDGTFETKAMLNYAIINEIYHNLV